MGDRMEREGSGSVLRVRSSAQRTPGDVLRERRGGSVFRAQSGLVTQRVELVACAPRRLFVVVIMEL